MCIISVLDDDYTSGREFAERLASILGFRLVDTQVLVERATAWGGNREDLIQLCAGGPRFVDRFLRSKRNQVLQLRAALAKDVREEKVVCYGIAAELLDLDARQIVRVQIKAPFGSRLLCLQQRTNLYGRDASKRLREGERRRARWRSYLYGTKAATSHAHAFLVDLDESSIDQACATVRHILERLAELGIYESDRASVKNWALCAAIHAAVAQNAETEDLDIDVTTEGDTVVLHAVIPNAFVPAIDGSPLPSLFPANTSSAIKAALERYPETRQLSPYLTIMGDMVVLRGIAYGAAEVSGSHPIPAIPVAVTSEPQRAPGAFETGHLNGRLPIHALMHRLPLQARGRLLLRTVGLATVAGALAMLALVYSSLPSGKKSVPSGGAAFQSFLGTITDSTCATTRNGHVLDADCVRSCVQTGGAKYVLSEDARVMIIGNQGAAERFAAQRVKVTGAFDKSTGMLLVASIEKVVP